MLTSHERFKLFTIDKLMFVLYNCVSGDIMNQTINYIVPLYSQYMIYENDIEYGGIDLSENYIELLENKFHNLSKNVFQDITRVINQTKEEAENDKNQFIKIKDNTIKNLVDYGVADLPMLERIGHVRENILTADEALNLGYSIKNKHFHGLGIEKYLKIMNSIDNPIGIYQYTNRGNYNSNNFIIVTPIEINGIKTIVPIEINQKGQYNQIEIKYNKIKTTYSKNNNNYIANLLKQGKIKEIFTGSNSQQTSLDENNIS